MPRSEQFYVEFITLTVLSLLAANLWIRFVMRLLDSHADSLVVDLGFAMGITIVAIFLMKTFFTRKSNEGLMDEPTHTEEMFDGK